jgi:iron complex outermembrane receptor protein
MNTMETFHKKLKAKSARKPRRILLTCLPILLCAVGLSAQDFPDVTAISLEDLMTLKVTSVSKRAQKLADAPAAIFVITQEDIHRSGAHNIPEALRLAPGIEVARIDESKWAITSRGFNGRFTNKLLVLIDGRSVYTPLFSGVYWNVQDVLLEDVDRIEIIRGPGATLWGANAVNGVINIMTKAAGTDQGGLVTASAGNELDGSGGARYSGKVGDTYYRTYAKYFKWQSSTDENGQDAFDGWNATRGGFRVDRRIGADSFTLQGDIYRGKYGETLGAPLLTAPYYETFRNAGNFSGGNIVGKWNHEFSRSRTTLQLYYDRANNAANALLVDHRNIYDLDFQHDIRLAENHEWIWGVGYRSTHDKTDASSHVMLTPNGRSWSLFSAFAQDEFGLWGQRVRVTLGSKFEYNDFTGFDTEPNARVIWTIDKKQSLWGAISRAVRTPARTEQDMRLIAAVIPPSAATGGLPVQATVFGDHKFESEHLAAYEAGYRLQATPSFSVDVATFYNSYSNLLSAEPGTPFVEADPLPVHITAPLVASNKISGPTYGGELFAQWKRLHNWKVSGAFTYLNMDIRRNADSLDTSTPDPAGASPKYQYYFRSSLDLPWNIQKDVTLRYVGKLAGLNIPSYYSLDAHIGWKATRNLELSIGGRNLLNKEHLEFRPDFIATSPTQVKRTFSAALTVKF